MVGVGAAAAAESSSPSNSAGVPSVVSEPRGTSSFCNPAPQCLGCTARRFATRRTGRRSSGALRELAFVNKHSFFFGSRCRRCRRALLRLALRRAAPRRRYLQLPHPNLRLFLYISVYVPKKNLDQFLKWGMFLHRRACTAQVRSEMIIMIFCMQ